jgi:nucleotide-binding universal stress UspA family protein
VVGRQGLSRSEEFLFGSVSSKIVNQAFFGSAAKKVLRRVRIPVFITPLPKE